MYCTSFSAGLFLSLPCIPTRMPAASIVFMSELVPAQRKALAVYPVMLFYLLIAWMVYIQ